MVQFILAVIIYLIMLRGTRCISCNLIQNGDFVVDTKFIIFKVPLSYVSKLCRSDETFVPVKLSQDSRIKISYITKLFSMYFSILNEFALSMSVVRTFFLLI